jgi:hypothetical protein
MQPVAGAGRGKVEEEAAAPAESDTVADRGRWVPVAAYNHPAFAHIARLKLESDGVECYLDNERLVSTVWLYSIATGGAKVMVREADAALAVESLREKVPYAADAAADDDASPGLVCPHCGSHDVAADRPWARLAAVSLLLFAVADAWPVFLAVGVGLAIWAAVRSGLGRLWKCGSCAHYWWAAAKPKGFDVVVTPTDPASAPRLPVPVIAVTPPPATAR